MLAFVNLQDHPTNRNKKVFYYHAIEHANYFENLLIENKIDFEKQTDEQGDKRIYFGIHISDFEKVKQLNYLTVGAFRKPFIADKFFRYFIIITSFIVMSLAIAGAIFSN